METNQTNPAMANLDDKIHQLYVRMAPLEAQKQRIVNELADLNAQRNALESSRQLIAEAAAITRLKLDEERHAVAQAQADAAAQQAFSTAPLLFARPEDADDAPRKKRGRKPSKTGKKRGRPPGSRSKPAEVAAEAAPKAPARAAKVRAESGARRKSPRRSKAGNGAVSDSVNATSAQSDIDAVYGAVQ